MLYFIGAGSGDPELLTVKGKRIIDSSDVIIYTGSLVNKELFTDIKEGAKLINSASLSLDEVLDIIFDSTAKGLSVARVHTGDPSMYGAIREQMVALDKSGIEYEVIPGVSSVFAGAAAMKAAVVYKASWPDQKIIVSTLECIADKVKEADINKTALVYVGRFLADEFELSKLYDKHFSHEFREAKDARR